jgi:hypothetical protein
MFPVRVNKGIFPAIETALNVPVGGTDNFSALQEPLVSPVAVKGSFIPQSGNVRTVAYDDTLIPYFLWKHGGDPDRITEFLKVNKTTVWDLRSGMRVIVPQVGSENTFPLHSEG